MFPITVIFSRHLFCLKILLRFTVWLHLYNTLEMTELQRWRINYWLPGFRNAGVKGDSLDPEHGSMRELSEWSDSSVSGSDSSVSGFLYHSPSDRHTKQMWTNDIGRTAPRFYTNVDFLLLMLCCRKRRYNQWGKLGEDPWDLSALSV